MKKKLFLIAILISITVITTSCWSQRELNELSIAMALGMDKADEDYQITVQVVLPQEVKEPSYYTPVKVYSEKAKSVFEAFRKMTTISPRKIYLSHFRVLVISEELAREGLSDVLDMLIRDHEFRSDYYVVIAKDGYRAKDILEIMTPFEKIPANEIYSILKTSEMAWAPTIGVQIDDIFTDLGTKGKESVLTGVTIKGGNIDTGESTKNIESLSPNNLLQFKEMAVFKEDKLIGWLDEEESKGYNYITDNVQSTVGRISCPKGGDLVVETKDSKAEIKGKYINGKPEIEINITSNVNIAEVTCDVDLKNPETIKELEESMNKRIKEIVENTVYAAQKEYKSDIFGFGEIIYENFPKEWKENNYDKNWDDEFEELKVTYNINGKILLTGTIDQSFHR